MATTDIDYGYLLGYAGSGSISVISDGVYVNSNEGGEGEDSADSAGSADSSLFLLNGSVVRSLTIPALTSYYLDLNEKDMKEKENLTDNMQGEDTGKKETFGVRSKIIVGEGLYNFSGNVTCEITKNFLDNVLKNDFFNRKSLFSLSMSDGNQSLYIGNNVWSSITLNYSAGQVPTCSISFSSNNEGNEDLIIDNSSSSSGNGEAFSDDDKIIPYWESGHNDFEIESFNISFSRSVQNVYLNNDLKVPTYMRAGLIDLSLNMNCYSNGDILSNENIIINLGNSKTLTIKGTKKQNHGFSISGLNSPGMINIVYTGTETSPSKSIFSFSEKEQS